MHEPRHRYPRSRSVAILLIAAAIGTALWFAGGAVTSSARPDSATTGFSAYVVATNTGPLPACSEDGSNCTGTNTVWDYVHVVNRNRPANKSGARFSVPNAFEVDSIDETVFVDGRQYLQFNLTPPPNVTPSDLPTWSSHWPATVVCDGSPPCTDIQNPAVVPGEDVAAVYTGWAHGDAEPNGTYIFKYTIHGTVNGAQANLTATAPPIVMTP
jgi:hypothetical protein